MSPERRVSVAGDRLRFAAAHMATIGDDLEPLHGHNYGLVVEVTGELTGEAWVWDFGDLKRHVRAIIDELDHRFLLQRESPLLEIREGGAAWEIRFRDRRYTFPREDVVALPLDNTTAERLAEWIAGRLVAHYRDHAPGFRRLDVGVEEAPGQAGWYTIDL